MIESIHLTWIVVKDVKKAIKFYTDVVGLKLVEHNEEYGWAELAGHNKDNGVHLGLAQQSPNEPIKAGQNGVFTLTVKDIEQAKKDVLKKGGKTIGDILDIPGHVKLQTVVDEDGNHFQLVQVMRK